VKKKGKEEKWPCSPVRNHGSTRKKKRERERGRRSKFFLLEGEKQKKGKWVDNRKGGGRGGKKKRLSWGGKKKEGRRAFSASNSTSSRKKKKKKGGGGKRRLEPLTCTGKKRKKKRGERSDGDSLRYWGEGGKERLRLPRNLGGEKGGKEKDVTISLIKRKRRERKGGEKNRALWGWKKKGEKGFFVSIAFQEKGGQTLPIFGCKKQGGKGKGEEGTAFFPCAMLYEKGHHIQGIQRGKGRGRGCFKNTPFTPAKKRKGGEKNVDPWVRGNKKTPGIERKKGSNSFGPKRGGREAFVLPDQGKRKRGGEKLTVEGGKKRKTPLWGGGKKRGKKKSKTGNR